MIPDRKASYDKVLRYMRMRVAQFEQKIIDLNYWNGLPEAVGRCVDIEPERLALRDMRLALQLYEEGREQEAVVPWQRAVKTMNEADVQQVVL